MWRQWELVSHERCSLRVVLFWFWPGMFLRQQFFLYTGLWPRLLQALERRGLPVDDHQGPDAVPNTPWDRMWWCFQRRFCRTGPEQGFSLVKGNTLLCFHTQHAKHLNIWYIIKCYPWQGTAQPSGPCCLREAPDPIPYPVQGKALEDGWIKDAQLVCICGYPLDFCT